MTQPATDDERRDREEYSVPPERDAHACAYCGTPFSDPELLALHHGLDHPEALTDEERAAFEDIYETEQEEISLFRLKALGLLVALYFGLLMTYAVVT